MTRIDSHAKNHTEEHDFTTDEKYWDHQAKKFQWLEPYVNTKRVSFKENQIDIKWFEHGKLNITHNLLDRHLENFGEKNAILWESDDGCSTRTLTFRELYLQVGLFSEVLRSKGVAKGHVVTIYMPMVPEAIVAMLACARVGAIHSVVFAGFSPESLANRIADSNSKVVITADEGYRAGKTLPLKNNLSLARDICLKDHRHTVHTTLVYQRTGGLVRWHESTDYWWHEEIAKITKVAPAEAMDAEDPLFILYTSGSTGRPKGLVHTTGGYMVYSTTTFKKIFKPTVSSIFWCTADIGWITGHSYLVYAPLCCGVTTLLYEGVPNWPEDNRMATLIDKYQVSILYTAPTVIRSLMAKSDSSLKNSSRQSLTTLGAVGEPINPEAWLWYKNSFGNGSCRVIDTWWQTETGGIMIAPYRESDIPCAGSAGQPFAFIKAAIVNDSGEILPANQEGNLVILDSWPGQARTIYGNHSRFEETYFTKYPGTYFTGDGAWKDEAGRYWITGRVDDVINVSGHRLGTAEIESAIALHDQVSEVAVVGVPHPLKGQAVYAYVNLKENNSNADEIASEIRILVRNRIGALATPETIHWIHHLPKTRSGKILRRLLRKLANGETENLGDLSTLADPAIFKKMKKEFTLRKNQ